MNGNLTIVGVRSFNDLVDGVKYDFTKVNVLIGFPRANEGQSGFDVQVAAFGKSENFAKFKGRKFPLNVTAEYELTTKGLELYEVAFEREVQGAKVG